ncbi:MAG: NAD-dependent epimerase/dehydratase family protein [Myxococcales bacterium]|nr:NAD-dependent epimerase/dehydratase family protein [Myxococcales bacterium]
MTARKVLVTGASGHLGNVLVRALLERGDVVRVLIEPGDAAPGLDGLEVERRWGDVRDEPAVQQAVQGVDVVCHLAGLVSITAGFEARMRAVNVEGTRHVLAACKAQKTRLLYMSSIHALSEVKPGEDLLEDAGFDETKAYGAYGRSKAEASRLVQAAARAGEVSATLLLPVGCVGPSDYRLSELGEVVAAVGRRKRPIIVTGGYHWVDVRDVASATIAAIERGRSGEAYLLSECFLSVKELCGAVAKAAGVRPPAVVLPLFIAQAFSWPMLLWEYLTKRRALMTPYALHTLTCRFQVPAKKAREELGFTPRRTEDSVADAWTWLSTHSRSPLLVGGATRPGRQLSGG